MSDSEMMQEIEEAFERLSAAEDDPFYFEKAVIITMAARCGRKVVQKENDPARRNLLCAMLGEFFRLHLDMAIATEGQDLPETPLH